MATTAATSTSPPETECDFRALTLQVKAAGLLERRLGYYAATIALTLAAFGAAWAGFVLIGVSWVTLAIAAALGVISTQLGFLGHDAGHRQIFRSQRANRLLGLLVGNGLIGLSYGWWVPKHHAHHAHPNQLGHDPDIDAGLVGPPPTADATDPNAPVGARYNLAAWMHRWQAELFFPLMLLRSTGLYVAGITDLIRRRDRAALTEAAILSLHIGGYLFVVFWVLSPLKALAFLGVHQAVFSIYLGCSFAPNHKGMPVLDEDDDMSFAQRQVITARNLPGRRSVSFVFGGLNYQIEHHLFPAMPRPNLARAQNLVRDFCADSGLGYAEETTVGSFRRIIRSLRLAALPAIP